MQKYYLHSIYSVFLKTVLDFLQLQNFKKCLNSKAVIAYQYERLKALTFLQLWKINNNFIKCR